MEMLKGNSLVEANKLGEMYYCVERNKFMYTHNDEDEPKELDVNDTVFIGYELKKKRWRGTFDTKYYYVVETGDIADIRCKRDQHDSIDDSRYNSGNYFETNFQAQEAACALQDFWEEYRGDKSTI